MTTLSFGAPDIPTALSFYNYSSKPEESNCCKVFPEVEKETGYSVDMRASTKITRGTRKVPWNRTRGS